LAEILREEKPFEEYEEDIELIDLKEELGEETYELLINNRYDTAIEVLTAGVEKLKEIEGFDEAKINEIIEIIKSQFEDEE
jgi:N utilization substance protein A